ncbi:YdhR family protein [Halobacteriaceae archaeon GCM10025711]
MSRPWATDRRFSPFASLASFVRLALAGEVRFPRGRVGETVRVDGREYTVFRELVHGSRERPDPPTVFLVRFRLARMPPSLNRLFSWLPVPFFAGLPGLRSKLWLVDESTEEFAGLYEWASPAAAERYADSFAMRFMTKRAAPGSVGYEIRPDTRREAVLGQ